MSRGRRRSSVTIGVDCSEPPRPDRQSGAPSVHVECLRRSVEALNHTIASPATGMPSACASIPTSTAHCRPPRRARTGDRPCRRRTPCRPRRPPRNEMPRPFRTSSERCPTPRRGCRTCGPPIRPARDRSQAPVKRQCHRLPGTTRHLCPTHSRAHTRGRRCSRHRPAVGRDTASNTSAGHLAPPAHLAAVPIHGAEHAVGRPHVDVSPSTTGEVQIAPPPSAFHASRPAVRSTAYNASVVAAKQHERSGHCRRRVKRRGGLEKSSARLPVRAVERIQTAVAAGDVDHAVVENRTRTHPRPAVPPSRSIPSARSGERRRASTTIVRREQRHPVGGGGIWDATSVRSQELGAGARALKHPFAQFQLLAPLLQPHAAAIDLRQLPLAQAQLRRGLDVSRLAIVRAFLCAVRCMSACVPMLAGLRSASGGTPSSRRFCSTISSSIAIDRHRIRAEQQCLRLPDEVGVPARTDRCDTRRAGRP